MQGWRRNCDVQFLIYNSPPHNMDATNISRVTNYVVAYACKGNESVVEEKKAIRAIIEAANEESGNHQDVKRLARKILNQATKNRIVSKQEAICQLVGLPLYSCSEAFQSVSMSGNVRLGTEDQSKCTFIAKYATRDPQFYEMSLHQYFHFKHNINPSRTRQDKWCKIPVYSGAQCEAVYPATVGYARGVLMIHSPWNGVFPVNRNDKTILDEFLAFVEDHTRCPQSVCVAYACAKLSQHMKEPTSNCNDIDYDSFTIKPDQYHQDLVELAGSIYHNYDEEKDSGDMNYDYGLEHNWSEQFVEVSLLGQNFPPSPVYHT